MKTLSHENSRNSPDNIVSLTEKHKNKKINNFNIISNWWFLFPLIFVPSTAPIFLSQWKHSRLSCCLFSVSICRHLKNHKGREGHYCKMRREVTHTVFLRGSLDQCAILFKPFDMTYPRLSTGTHVSFLSPQENFSKNKQKNKPQAYHRENQPMLWLLLFFEGLYHQPKSNAVYTYHYKFSYREQKTGEKNLKNLSSLLGVCFSCPDCFINFSVKMCTTSDRTTCKAFF